MKASVLAALAATLLTSSTDALQLAKRDNPRVVGFPVQRRQTSKIVVSSALRRRATVTQTLDNFEDGSLYFANATIGTPGQNFRFHLDTGSSDLWANTQGSQICQATEGNTGPDQNGNIPCSVSGTYNANDSSSYNYVNSDFQIKYADGTGAAGDYVTDTFSMGGATIQNQQFGVGYQSTSSEGVMGIGYPRLEAIVQSPESDSNTASYSNIPQSMVQQGLINSQAYSLWLDDVNSLTGSILFGGVDTAKYQGSLVSMDIVKEQGEFLEMVVALDGAWVNADGKNQTVLTDQTFVLLDSGSTLSYLPNDTANAIIDAVGAQYDPEQQIAFCSCDLANSSSVVGFSFAGGQKVITASMTDMVLEGGISRSLDCTFGIVPEPASSSAGASFTLGDTFIRNAYVVYDISNNQISLAQTDQTATDSNVMEIQNGTSGVPDVTGSAAPPSATLGGDSGAVGGSGNSASSSSGVMPTSAPNIAAAVIAGAGLMFAAV